VDDSVDLAPVARPAPHDRFGELARADPEEAGHLVVELALDVTRRRGGASARPCVRVVGKEAPGHWSGGREDRKQVHVVSVTALGQRAMFGW